MEKAKEIDFDVAKLNLADLVEIEYLQNIQNAFSKAFDMPAIIYDTNGKPLTQASCFTNFCSLLRSTAKGRKNCEAFDKKLVKELKNLKEPIYRKGCAISNMVTVAYPIHIKNKHLANFAIGQVSDGLIKTNEIKKYAKEIGLDEKILLSQINSILPIEKTKLTKAVEFLSVIINQVIEIGIKNLQNRLLNERKLEYERQIAQKNELLNLAFDNDKVAWWDWNYETGHVEYSPSKATMIGYKAEEFPNQVYEITSLLHPKDYENTMKDMSDYLQGKKDCYETIYRIKNKNKSYSYFYDYGKIIERKDDGSPKHLFGIVFNINKQKKIENELKIAIEKAKESDQLKSSFLHNISHEVRTPMNAIMGFSDLLLNPNLEQDRRIHFSEIIHKSLNQLLMVIENTITIAHIETKQIKINKTEFSPNKLINDLYIEFLDTIQKTGRQSIELTIKTTINTNLLIKSDYSYIKQIIHILIDNSLKFTEKGTIEIGCSFKEKKIEFYVKDTGIGIEKKKQEIIFKSFAQADKSITEHYGGIGLGLAIASGLIKALNGEMKIESEENIGTLISFKIPINNIQNKEQSKIRIPKKKESPITILFVDDEINNFEYIEEIIDPKEILLTHAVNGKIGLEEFNKKKFDLILMDLKMPIMDGFEATKEIRKTNKTIPIIAQTAYPYKQEECSIAGFTDYITKPYTEDQLINKIHEYINNASLYS